jgi:hypothetical protein
MAGLKACATQAEELKDLRIYELPNSKQESAGRRRAQIR